MTTFIETERLELKPLELRDAEDLQEIFHSNGMQNYGGANTPVTIEDEKEWIKETDSIALGIWLDDKMIGYLGLSKPDDIHRSADTYIYLKDQFQANGYGPEALRAFLDYAFKNLNLHRVEAQAFTHNEPSNKLMERLGFQKEGVRRQARYKNGEWRDLNVYGLLREEFNQQT